MCVIKNIILTLIIFISCSSIPTRIDVRLKWIDAIGREVPKNTAVCSKHFHEDDIFTYIKDGTIRRRLRPGAIPTLHFTKEMLR